MAKYVYPAVFTKEKDGKYSIVFPDLEGCYTTGDNLADGIYMAEDVLTFTLYSLEKNNQNIPNASEKLSTPKGSFVNYVACDTNEIRNYINTSSPECT